MNDSYPPGDCTHRDIQLITASTAKCNGCGELVTTETQDVWDWMVADEVYEHRITSVRLAHPPHGARLNGP